MIITMCKHNYFWICLKYFIPINSKSINSLLNEGEHRKRKQALEFKTNAYFVQSVYTSAILSQLKVI